MADIRAIISNDDPNLLLQGALELARTLQVTDETTVTQVRRIFSTMRQIELGWPTDTQETERAERAYRKLMLLHPRLSYQAFRHPPIRSLTRDLQAAILQIGPHDRIKLQRLMEFFEAVLAFYISQQTSLEGGTN